MATCSVIIITLNEEARIGRCLDSVAWADQIVVVDSGSTDGTVTICQAAGAEVYHRDWPGYGPQKNRALEFATGEWVLSLDADEYLSPELTIEIRNRLEDPGGCNAFRLPRLSTFCGRAMRHSGWWPDPVLRLFRRGRARFSDDLVHERVVADEPVTTLRGLLHHESVRTLDEARAKVDAYSTAGAEALHARGRRSSLMAAVSRGGWTFLRTFILQAGFLDGRMGFHLAVANARGSFHRHAKLAMLGSRR